MAETSCHILFFIVFLQTYWYNINTELIIGQIDRVELNL